MSTNPPTGTLSTSMAPGGMQAPLPIEHQSKLVLTPLSLQTARSNQLFPCSSISIHSPLLATNANPHALELGVYTRANQDWSVDWLKVS